MIQRESIRFKIAWISLTIIGVAIFVFGLIVTVWPGSSDTLFLRTIGVASIGMGLFGVMITMIPYKRHERWAWFTLWYYPIFWLAHFLGGLPPGQDHIHQIVFIVLALVSLLISMSEFFGRGMVRRA
ncbi:MAG: hypothetical protein SH847_06545 [Roseiflexaceae bacterium]|nr:hypothetical protein [Roseiflexaceae bacterium]